MKPKTMRNMAVIAAVAFALVAIMPAAQAGAPKDGNGHISRTFLAFAQIDWKPHEQNPEGQNFIGGAGWYDPDDIDDLCPALLFGFTVGPGFYYPRLTKNGPNVHVLSVIGDFGFFINCPPTLAAQLGTDGTDNFLGSSGFNVWAPAPSFSQSHLLCADTSTGTLCSAKPATAQWTAYRCTKPGLEFVAGEVLNLALGVDVGSSSVNDGTCEDGVKYNLTKYLNPFDAMQTSYPDPHVDDVVPLGSGDSYVVSCYSMKYNKFPDPLGASPYLASSHDWFLVLDWASLGPGTVATLLNDLGAPEIQPMGGPTSLALKGWYDLSGDNGCPPEGDLGVEEEDFEPKKKDKDAPLIGPIDWSNQCSDLKDNDGDGLADLDDPDCAATFPLGRE